jgi:excisionase family DNA binding protein
MRGEVIEMEMLLTVEQVATRLNLHPVTVREHLSRGILRGIKRGRQWRVPESALVESRPIGSKWEQAGNAGAALYAESLATGGDLTAISDAEGGFYEGGAA